MKILAFAGSNSQNSINKQLVSYVAKSFSDQEVEILDLHDFEMPLFSVDREKHDGIPQLALQFAQKIDAADLLLISLAEHNSAYTVAFKNVFDWVSRIKDRKHFGEKPVFLMATATGPGGGKHVLEAFEKRAPFSGAAVLESFSLPKFADNFSAENGIVNEEKAAELKSKTDKVKAAVGL